MCNMKKYAITIKESITQSVIKDTYTFGCLLFSFYVNKTYLGNATLSTFLVTMTIITILGVLISNLSDNEKTIDEAIEFLEKEKSKEAR